MSNEHDVKCGLEIHQQLDTGKLFCQCPSHLDEEFGVEIDRRLRPTQSEMGEVDRAALAEARKGRTFHYESSSETACLVEADEEPPHAINDDALDTALTIAAMTDMNPADEVHTMRKIVIDGSNTTGFQRTALVAKGGSIEIDDGEIGLEAMAIEEDAARIMSRGSRQAHYRLDRLGIPLVEIATAPQLHSPEAVKQAAERIGTMIRATGKAKRGLGTIRQDLNISIPGGARVEVKGVQDLDLLPTYVEEEMARQQNFIALAERLDKAADRDELGEPVDVTEAFEGTDSSVIQGALDGGGKVCALALPGFDGLLGTKEESDHRLGRELAGYARTQGASGLFHTDELPAYGITGREVARVHGCLGTNEGEDAFCLVAADEDVAQRSLEAALDRAEKAFDGVPEETREALEDGLTRYLRPLPGSARMYPETDAPPARIDADRMDEIRANLPEMPDEKHTRYQDELGLSEEMADALAGSQRAFLFDEFVEATDMPKQAARAVLQTRPNVEDEGVEVSDELLKEALVALSEDVFAKDALPDVLEKAAREAKPVDRVADEMGLGKVDEAEIRAVLDEIVEANSDLVDQRGMGAMGALMGEAMGRLKGKADGETINQLLQEAIQERT
jgi:glutamyl-tRNA(Gln) amidotransferase subunit E